MTQRREMSRERGVLAASLVPLPLPLPEAGQVRGSRSHTPGDGSYRTWGLPPNHPAYGGRRAERKPEVTEPRGLDGVALQLMLQRPRVRGTEAQGTSYWRDTDYREGTGEKKLLQEKKNTCCERLIGSHPRDSCHSDLENVGDKRTRPDTGLGRQNQGQPRSGGRDTELKPLGPKQFSPEKRDGEREGPV